MDPASYLNTAEHVHLVGPLVYSFVGVVVALAVTIVLFVRERRRAAVPVPVKREKSELVSRGGTVAQPMLVSLTEIRKASFGGAREGAIAGRALTEQERADHEERGRLVDVLDKLSTEGHPLAKRAYDLVGYLGPIVEELAPILDQLRVHHAEAKRQRLGSAETSLLEMTPLPAPATVSAKVESTPEDAPAASPAPAAKEGLPCGSTSES